MLDSDSPCLINIIRFGFIVDLNYLQLLKGAVLALHTTIQVFAKWEKQSLLCIFTWEQSQNPHFANTNVVRSASLGILVKPESYCEMSKKRSWYNGFCVHEWRVAMSGISQYDPRVYEGRTSATKLQESPHQVITKALLL